MKDWKKVKLGEVADVVMGQSPKSEFYNKTGEGMPFLQGNRTFGEKYPSFDTFCTDNKRFAEPKEVIMSVRAPVGDLNIATTRISLGRGVCALKMKNNNNNFLYYLLTHFMSNLINRQSGTVFGSVNRKNISGLDIVISEKPDDQKAIADVLSAFDDKIENNNKQNELLEKTAQALYKAWFVEFNFPNSDGKPYKASGGEMVYNEQLKKNIPKGWVIECVKDIAFNNDIICGKTPSTKVEEYYGGDIPFITIPDMHNSTYIIKPSRYLTGYGAESQSKKTLPKNSVCVSCIATPGLVILTSEPSQTNQQINSIVCKEGISPYYIYLNFLLRKDEIINMGSGGTTTYNLNKKGFSNIKIILPTNKYMQNFNIKVKYIFDKILENQKENETLKQTRDTLLPKLMSGEVRVKGFGDNN